MGSRLFLWRLLVERALWRYSHMEFRQSFLGVTAVSNQIWMFRLPILLHLRILLPVETESILYFPVRLLNFQLIIALFL